MQPECFRCLHPLTSTLAGLLFHAWWPIFRPACKSREVDIADALPNVCSPCITPKIEARACWLTGCPDRRHDWLTGVLQAMPPDIPGDDIAQACSHGLQVLSRAAMPPEEMEEPDGVESELSPLLVQVLVPWALE
jgi:hypothetical protein